MFELFKNEIWRLKIWIIIPALIYLLLNAASIYYGEYADSGLMIGNIHSVIFAMSSLLLGLVQFHTYKKPNRWIYLINRPASTSSLCLTLLATGSVIVLCQFVIPDLILTISMDNLSPFLIEKRHYFQALYVFLISMAFYLCGVYIQLSHSKGAFLVLVLPIIAISSLLIGGPVITISFIVVLWLLLLVISVFKANTHNNHVSILGKILAIIPFQLGLYFILVMALSFIFQLRYMLIDGAGSEIPWNEYFGNDVYSHIRYLDGYEQLTINLLEADKKTQDELISQMKHIKTQSTEAKFNSFYPSLLLPYQQKIENLKIIDTEKDMEWTFSFDQMVFINSVDNSLILMKGKDQSTGFITFPKVINNLNGYQVVTENEIYSYDKDFQQLNLRFQLSDKEKFISGFNSSGTLTNLLTTKNMYFFDSEMVEYSTNILTPLTVVELPGAFENLASVEIAEMIDRTLIGFLFGKLSNKGHYPAEQIMLEIVTANNKTNTLARRPLNNGFGENYDMINWYISPLTHWVSEYVLTPQLKPVSLKPISNRPELFLSFHIKTLILIMILLSVIFLLWFLRKRDLITSEKAAWIVLICFTGITGLITFLLLTDKKIHLNTDINTNKIASIK